MSAKPIKSLELRYTMIQFLVIPCIYLLIFLLALPPAPLKANLTVVKSTKAAINWTQVPDDISGKLRYSVDCFKCKYSKDKDCKEPCGPSVQYKPSKDNITVNSVEVNGLQSCSFYLFRVYSVNELNQHERDREKWNYATVFVGTKGESMLFFDVI